MEKFQRVAETQAMPEYIKNQFVPQDDTEEADQYKELRAGSGERRRLIAREENTGRQVRGEREPDRSWERETRASVYEDRKFEPEDERMSNLNPYDVNANGVRRASYDTDQGDNARPNPAEFRFIDQVQATNMLKNDASIWAMYDVNDMEDTLHMAMAIEDERTGHVDPSEYKLSPEQRRAERHSRQEREDLDEQRGFKYSNLRGNRVIRTANEFETASDFGRLDFKAIEEAEARRLQSIDDRRQERLSIKESSRRNSAERHDDWQTSHSEDRAQTVQEHDTSWLNDFMSKLKGR